MEAKIFETNILYNYQTEWQFISEANSAWIIWFWGLINLKNHMS